MSDIYAVPNKLPAKQVAILAHRKKRLTELKSHDRVKQINRKFKLRKKARDFKKAEAFINEFRQAERDNKRMIRAVKQKQLFRISAGDMASLKSTGNQKIIIAMRHRAHRIASPIINKILGDFRLGILFNCVFLPNNAETIGLLRLVDPYVVWGYPSINTVRDIIFKHGFLRINSKRTTINSNKLIEDKLGKYGIICIEDIVLELFSAGEQFNKVRNILLPFKLKAPLDGWKHKTGVSFDKGGEFGNRKSEINALINRCM